LEQTHRFSGNRLLLSSLSLVLLATVGFVVLDKSHGGHKLRPGGTIHLSVGGPCLSSLGNITDVTNDSSAAHSLAPNAQLRSSLYCTYEVRPNQGTGRYDSVLTRQSNDNGTAMSVTVAHLISRAPLTDPSSFRDCPTVSRGSYAAIIVLNFSNNSDVDLWFDPSCGGGFLDNGYVFTGDKNPDWKTQLLPQLNLLTTLRN
jgi:hypothetical protein